MIDERAAQLFQHLPDDELLEYVPGKHPPLWSEIAGHAALTVEDAVYVVIANGVFVVRDLGDGSDEIVTYRCKRRVNRVVIPAGVVIGSTYPKLS